MNTCPICHKPVSGRECESCGYDLSGDFTAFRTLSPVSAADQELLKTKRELAAVKLQLAALSEKAPPESTTPTERTEREYDINGNVTKETVYDADGSVKCRRGYTYLDGSVWLASEYDKAERMTKTTYYNADGSVSAVSEYDEARHETKRTFYNADGSVDFWEDYEYDKAGRRTKATSYNADGSVRKIDRTLRGEKSLWLLALIPVLALVLMIADFLGR